MVLWYNRIRATMIAVTHADNARLLEELPQLTFHVTVVCTLHARPSNYHQIPTWWQRPNTNDLSDPPLSAVTFYRATYLLSNHQAKAAYRERAAKSPHCYDATIVCPATPEHGVELLARGQ